MLLGDFLEELHVLLSTIPENVPPLVLLGDFNIQTERSSDLLLLLSSFALSLSPSPPTHKAGNHLDHIFTRNCSTSNLTVRPLHVSDHFFISYSLPLSQTNNPTTSTDSVPVHRNIRSLSPSSLASSVLSALPSTDSFSLMHPTSATDTLLSTPLLILSVLLRHNRYASPPQLRGCLTRCAPTESLCDDSSQVPLLLPPFYQAILSTTLQKRQMTNALDFQIKLL